MMKLDKFKKSIKLGYLYVVLASILFGISGAASKYLFNDGMTPFQLIQLRTTLAFTGLCLWLGIEKPHLLRISVKDIIYFLPLGTLGVAAAQFLYLFAISKINVAAAILLHYTGPVFVALYSVVVARERLTPLTIAAIMGSLVGCGLVVEAYNLELLSMNRIGIIGGMMAAVAFAVYSILGEYGMRTYHPLTVLFYAMLFAALTWNILHPPLEAFGHAYSAISWGLILFVGIFGTILPFALYFAGINLIRATHASITATLEPLTAGIIAFLFLGEVLGPLQIFGGVIVIAAIILLQWKQELDEKAPHLTRNETT